MITPDEAREAATLFMTEFSPPMKETSAILRDLAQQVEDLQADAARLDWMGKKLAGASDSERYLPFRIYWGGGSHKTIRQVIDEAMK